MTQRPDPNEHCSWPPLEARHAEALRAAVSWIFENLSPRAILVAGSIVRGTGDARSDFDIHVLHDAPYKQRIQRWFGDVPAEIFVNPVASVREYFASEAPTGKPSTAHMFATGFAIFGHDLLSVLRNEAKGWLDKPAFLTEGQATWARYSAATLFEDAEDVAARDPELASALLAEAVLAMLRFRLRKQTGWLPGSKRLFDELARDDPQISEGAREFFRATRIEERLAAAALLADRCLGTRGFFEWESEQVSTS